MLHSWAWRIENNIAFSQVAVTIGLQIGKENMPSLSFFSIINISLVLFNGQSLKNIPVLSSLEMLVANFM